MLHDSGILMSKEQLCVGQNLDGGDGREGKVGWVPARCARIMLGILGRTGSWRHKLYISSGRLTSVTWSSKAFLPSLTIEFSFVHAQWLISQRQCEFLLFFPALPALAEAFMKSKSLSNKRCHCHMTTRVGQYIEIILLVTTTPRSAVRISSRDTLDVTRVHRIVRFGFFQGTLVSSTFAHLLSKWESTSNWKVQSYI